MHAFFSACPFPYCCSRRNAFFVFGTEVRQKKGIMYSLSQYAFPSALSLPPLFPPKGRKGVAKRPAEAYAAHRNGHERCRPSAAGLAPLPHAGKAPSGPLPAVFSFSRGARGTCAVPPAKAFSARASPCRPPTPSPAGGYKKKPPGGLF